MELDWDGSAGGGSVEHLYGANNVETEEDYQNLKGKRQHCICNKYNFESQHWRRLSSRVRPTSGLIGGGELCGWLATVGLIRTKTNITTPKPAIDGHHSPAHLCQRRQAIIELSVLAKLSTITVLSGFPPRFVIVAHTQTPNQDHLRRIFL